MNWPNSDYYSFWDGLHIPFINGFALNTSDSIYEGIAILRYYAPNEKKAIDLMADVVINNYYEIDTIATGPVPISSAYRNPRRNDEKGGAQNSYHIYGRAIDFDEDFEEDLLLVRSAVFTAGGYGYFENPPTGHIHAWWPYNP